MLAPKEPSCIDELIKKPDLNKPSGQKKAVKLGKKIPKSYWKWRIRQCYIDGAKVFTPEYIRNKWYYFWCLCNFYYIDKSDYEKYIADKASFRTIKAPRPGSFADRIWFFSEEAARQVIELMEQAHCQKVEMATQRLIYVKRPQE